MVVTSSFQDETLYITLSGEIGEQSVQSARSECDKLIEEYSNAKKIIINLSKIKFMDSTGVGFLIGRQRRALSFSIPVYLQEPSPAADMILNLSGLYSLIPKIE